MGHLSFMKQEYRRLHGRLMKGPVGMPVPDDPDARQAMYEILSILFPPEDAELASRLPLRPSSAATVAELTGVPLADAQKRLETMAHRGAVVDLVNPETDEVLYVLAPPVIGFFEFSLMRRNDGLPKRRLAEAMERYMHGDTAFLEELAGETGIGRALVHETVLSEELSTEVLSYERASEIIRSAKTGAVSVCYCRHKAEHLGKACDTPQETCTTLGNAALWATRHGFGRKASTSELLEILDRARALGLVQMADNVREAPGFICHCCGCCCEALSGLSRHGIQGFIKSSNYLAAVDTSRCKGCSRCARACPVQAVSMHPLPRSGARRRTLMPRIDETICLGCGVCAGACRQKAMGMKARAERVFTPENVMARILYQTIERGRLQHLIFETAGRPTPLRRLLAALGGLPPVQRYLARDQVKSRFVSRMLGRTSPSPRS